MMTNWRWHTDQKASQNLWQFQMVLLLLLLAATMHKGCIHLHSNQHQQDLPCASGSAGGEFEPLTVMPFDGRVPVNDATSVN